MLQPHPFVPLNEDDQTQSEGPNSWRETLEDLVLDKLGLKAQTEEELRRIPITLSEVITLLRNNEISPEEQKRASAKYLRQCGQPPRFKENIRNFGGAWCCKVGTGLFVNKTLPLLTPMAKISIAYGTGAALLCTLFAGRQLANACAEKIETELSATELDKTLQSVNETFQAHIEPFDDENDPTQTFSIM